MAGLYTMMMEFRGGTYISQVIAKDEWDALILAISNLKVENIQYMGSKTKAEMLKEAVSESPVPISCTQNVFITSLLPFGHFTTIHLIGTVPIKD